MNTFQRICSTCKVFGLTFTTTENKIAASSPQCMLVIHIPKIEFEYVSGDKLAYSKLVRDISVLALDKPYYYVTMEETLTFE